MDYTSNDGGKVLLVIWCLKFTLQQLQPDMHQIMSLRNSWLILVLKALPFVKVKQMYKSRQGIIQTIVLLVQLFFGFLKLFGDVSSTQPSQ